MVYDILGLVRLLIDIRKVSDFRRYISNKTKKKRENFSRILSKDARIYINALYTQSIHVQEKPSFVLDLNFNGIL